MAQIISTYDGFALSGHIARGQLQSSIPIQTGVVESFKQELECSINPLATNQVVVGTGMGIAGYLAWENSEQHMLEFFGNGTYNIVCTIDATNNPATIAIEYLPTSTTLITENLVANPNGIHQQLLATATIVSGTVDTLVDKRNIINMQTTIDAILVKFGNYLPLLGGTMTGTINGKAINATSFTNSGVTTLNSTVNINATTNAKNINCGNVVATRLDSNGGGIFAGAGNYDAQGGKVFAESLGLETTTGSGLMSVFKYKNTTGFDVLKDMYTKSIFGVGTLEIDTANFGGFVQTNDVTAWAQSAEYMRVLHPNGNSQFKMGKDTSNPTFAQTKGYLNWYDSGGTLNISLRPGASTAHGVVHESRDGAFKLAYVNTSLNSALLMSNQMLIQNIESQQEMAFSTPTIDFDTINTLEAQKQSLLEQNAVIEQEIMEIEQEIQDINNERVI